MGGCLRDGAVAGVALDVSDAGVDRGLVEAVTFVVTLRPDAANAQLLTHTRFQASGDGGYAVRAVREQDVDVPGFDGHGVELVAELGCGGE